MCRLAMSPPSLQNRLLLLLARPKKKAPPARCRPAFLNASRVERGGWMRQAYFAPVSNHLAMVPRSSSVILVMFPSGMAFCTTTCW